MLLSIIILIISLVFILVGANKLTDGASAVAARWGVSDLIIGLTVVAFGTSTPELVISIVSAFKGSAPLAIGNVVGSNIFNILAIVGITAAISPIKIGKSILTTEIPLVIISSVLLLTMANGPLLDSASSSILTRIDGIVLLIFFIIFMRHTFASAKTAPKGKPQPEQANVKPISGLLATVYIIGGLVALIAGGEGFVRSASALAARLGVSESVIGLTIVAAGTSLPELATSIAAALKGKEGIAVGNVIGSNIFNIFLVLGITSTIKPLSFGAIGNFDLLTLTAASILFWIFGWFFRQRTITRIEGAILAAGYIIYIAALIIRS